MTIRKFICSSSAVSALICVTAVSHAAEITWSTGSLSSDSTIINESTSVGGIVYPYTIEALNFNGDNDNDHSENDVSINGIDFLGSTNSSSTYLSANSTSIVNQSTDYYTSSSPSANLEGLLGNFIFGGDTLTLSNLTVGHEYLIQLFIGDQRAQSDATRHEWLKLDGTLWDTGTNTPIFRDATGSALGVWAIGTFTADATSQTISLVKWRTGPDQIQGTSDDTATNLHLDAYQLRATSLPEVIPEIDLAGDTDGDGWRDTIELMLDTDPFDGSDYFGVAIDYSSEGGVSLTWPSAAEVTYTVKYTSNLTNETIEIAGPFASETGTDLNYIDTDPSRNSEDAGFYSITAHLPPPNIVFLMSDDHVAMAMGNMGHPDHPEVITPHMDTLASSGVRFDRAYANTAICRPSRATTLTGVYEYKHVTNFNASNDLATSLWNDSYPIQLKNNGYRIAFAGKWGFGMELSQAQYSAQFDKWGGFATDGQGSYNTASNPAGIAAYASEYPHVSRALGAFGQDFIKESVAADEQFCLTIFFKAPHLPNNTDPAVANLYDHVDEFVLPTTWNDSFNTLLPDQPRFGRPHERRYVNNATYQTAARGYYKLISGMDAAIGMVMEELKEQGVAHNTVLIYTSDNGYFLGSHGTWFGKVMPHEEGSRIPLIVYDPRAELRTVGTTSDAIVGSIDYGPTILSYANVPVPSIMDGIPLQPLIQDPSASVRDAMLLIQNWTETDDDLSRALCVVTEQYKYTFWPYGDVNVSPAEEVYDIPADPFEINNIASTLDTTTMNQLRAYYDGFVQDWKDNVPTGVTDYERMGTIFDRAINHTSKTFAPIPSNNTKYRSNYQDVTGIAYPN